MRRLTLALFAAAALAPAAAACGPFAQRRAERREARQQASRPARTGSCCRPAPRGARVVTCPAPAPAEVVAASHTTAPHPGSFAPAGVDLPPAAYLPATRVPLCGPAGCPQ